MFVPPFLINVVHMAINRKREHPYLDEYIPKIIWNIPKVKKKLKKSTKNTNNLNGESYDKSEGYKYK